MWSSCATSCSAWSRVANRVEAQWLVYADAQLLVLDKPAGMLAVPGRTLTDCLSALVQQQFPDARVVHRLDMATSGLMLMARGAAAQSALSRAFAERAVGKRYVAIVHGRLRGTDPHRPRAWDLIDLALRADWPRRPLQVVDALRGKPSQTRWRVLASDPLRQRTRLELEPVTGRSHQLRVHLQAIGHPIVGDALYDAISLGATAETPRLLLHATQLRLLHPVTGARLYFTSSVPF